MVLPVLTFQRSSTQTFKIKAEKNYEMGMMKK